MGSLLIVNPRASAVSDALVERVVAELPAQLVVVPTGAPGEATEIARAARSAPSTRSTFSRATGTYNEGAERRDVRRAARAPSGRRDEACRRGLSGSAGDPVAAARRLARGGTRPIGPGSRQRTPVLVQRRCSGSMPISYAASTSRAAVPTGVAPGDRRVRGRGGGGAPRLPPGAHLHRPSRPKASVAQRSALAGELRPVHVRRAHAG